jgi:transposase
MNSQGLLARRRPMPTPIAPRISLPQNARTNLQALARAHSTPQTLALRARIILRAGELESPTNLNIAHELGCSNLTMGKWRRRYQDLGVAGLQDAPRPGRPRTIASPTRVQVISVASTLPQNQNRTVTRWTLNEIVTALSKRLKRHEVTAAGLQRDSSSKVLRPG